MLPADRSFLGGIPGSLEATPDRTVAEPPRLPAKTARDEGRIAIARNVAGHARLIALDFVDHPVGDAHTAASLQSLRETIGAFQVDPVTVDIVIARHPPALYVVDSHPQGVAVLLRSRLRWPDLCPHGQVAQQQQEHGPEKAAHPAILYLEVGVWSGCDDCTGYAQSDGWIGEFDWVD